MKSWFNMGCIGLALAMGMLYAGELLDKVETSPTVTIDQVTPIVEDLRSAQCQVEIHWQRWKLADGTVTWGPSPENKAAYTSFFNTVVTPAKSKFEQDCKDGNCYPNSAPVRRRWR